VNALRPRILVSVDHGRIVRAEDAEIGAGAAIADALRQMADRIEREVGVIPYGSGEWVRERHSYTDADGRALGVLILDEVER
jgi:hypothetical protein